MTVYCERANGRFEYWTYADGQRVMLTPALATKLMHQGATFCVVS
jgi:hypothetical protein